MERIKLDHPIPPTYDENSRVLILGSFPSVRSREMGYFYGHPQNRFWRVMAALFEEAVPQTVEERRSFLLRNHVSAWDVIASCSIEGSSDSSIKDVAANDLRPVLRDSQITRIFVNGKTAERLYLRHASGTIALPCRALPSTSPANAGWSEARLIAAWQPVRDLADGL